MPPWLVIPRGLSTLYRAYTISSITGFKPLLGLPGVKGLITAYIWRNPSSSNSHPHRICNFRTLSFGLDLNADDQYSQLKGFKVRDLTDWANENHTLLLYGLLNRKTVCRYLGFGHYSCNLLICYSKWNVPGRTSSHQVCVSGIYYFVNST